MRFTLTRPITKSGKAFYFEALEKLNMGEGVQCSYARIRKNMTYQALREAGLIVNVDGYWQITAKGGRYVKFYNEPNGIKLSFFDYDDQMQAMSTTNQTKAITNQQTKAAVGTTVKLVIVRLEVGNESKGRTFKYQYNDILNSQIIFKFDVADFIEIIGIPEGQEDDITRFIFNLHSIWQMQEDNMKLFKKIKVSKCINVQDVE